jgi:hypothetical protein
MTVSDAQWIIRQVKSDPNLTPDHLHSAVDNIVALGGPSRLHVAS